MDETAFTVEDTWQGLVGTTWLYAVAGQDRHSDLGAIVLYSLPSNPNDGNDPTLVGEFASSSASDLTIVSVNNDIVTLADARGETLPFNLATRTFA